MFDLIITGVVDGSLSGGLPKAIEFYVVNDICDLSAYGFGSANNGDGSDGQEYTFSGSARAGDYLYVSSESAGFTSFFGFEPTDTASAANINGDDAIELFKNGEVIDVFGDVEINGSGEPWDYGDGWAYRVNRTAADGSFDTEDWRFSGPDVLDDELLNTSAAMPFPARTYLAGDIANEPEDPLPEDPQVGGSEQFTRISSIQGSGAMSPLVGEQVSVEAVVVGDFQGESGLSGFYLQEESC